MPKSIEKNKKLLSILILAVAFSMGIFITTFASTNYAFADSTTNSRSTGASRVSLTLAPIITLRILDSTASSEITSLPIDITPTPNGAFAKNSLIVEGATSNPTGYKLYMNSIGTNPVSSNGSINGDNSGTGGGNSGTGGSTSSNTTYTTDLVNIDSSVPSDIGLIPTLNTNTTITEAEFRVRNSNYRNRWGYSLNGLTISSNTDSSTGEVTNTITENTDTSTISYHDIPANSEQRMIDEKETESDKGLTPITIGVNATSGLASGTYKNTLEFTAIANEIPIDYKLTFNANTDGAGGEDMSQITNLYSPLTYSSIASSHTFTLPNPADNSNALIRDNYMFSGWNTKPDGTGDTYKAGAEYTIVIDDTNPYSNENTLYATWKPLPNFWKIANMQDMTTTVCNSVYTPTNATELTTPKAIMIDKLAAQAGKYEATSDNTSPNVAQSTLSDIRDGKTYTVRKMADGNCWMAENLKLDLTAGAASTAATFSGGTVSWTPNSGSGDAYNVAINANYQSNVNGGNWYYPWYAATAGQGTQTASPTINRSICPKGWRLPDGNTSTKSFYNLITTKYGLASSSAGVNSLKAAPLSFVATGYYSGGSLRLSSSGYDWSATPYTSGANYAHYLDFSTSGIYPQNYNNKNVGFSVRCISI